MVKPVAKQKGVAKDTVHSFKRTSDTKLDFSRALSVRGSSIPVGSYFGFNVSGKLVYAAIKQKATASYVQVRISDDNALKFGSGTVNLGKVFSEMEANINISRTITNRKVISGAHSFSPSKLKANTGKFTDVHLERAAPFTDDDDDEIADETTTGKRPQEDTEADPPPKKSALQHEDEEDTEADPPPKKDVRRHEDEGDDDDDAPLLHSQPPKKKQHVSPDEDATKQIGTDIIVVPEPEAIEQAVIEQTSEVGVIQDEAIVDTNQVLQITDQTVQQALSGTLPTQPVEQPQEDQTQPTDTPQDEPVDSLQATQEETKKPEEPEIVLETREEVDKKTAELVEKEAERVEETIDEDASDRVHQAAEVDQQAIVIQRDQAVEQAAEVANANAILDKDMAFDELTDNQKTARLDSTVIGVVAQTESNTEGEIHDEADDAMDEVPVQEPIENSVFATGRELEDKSEEGGTLMSVEKSGDTAPMDLSNQSKYVTSANAGAQIEEERQILLEKDAIMNDVAAKARKEQLAQQKAKRKADIEENKKIRASFPSGVPDKFREGLDVGMTGIEEEKQNDSTSPSQSAIDEILQKISLIGTLRKENSTDEQHQLMLQKIALEEAKAAKFEFASSINIQRMAPPSDAERVRHIARDAIRARAAAGLEGEFGIYAPTDSFSEIHKMQSKLSGKIGTMTYREAAELRAKMEPWWREFGTARTNQGVQNMERMPTRILQSPLGDVHTDTAVSEDVTQGEKDFYNFMYWLMRTHMEMMDGRVYWEELFRYSSAMGYNDISEERFNWLISGNPNGDTSGYEYEGMDAPLDVDNFEQTPVIRPFDFVDPVHFKIVSKTISFTPVPFTPVPSKNQSPSAGAGTIKRTYKIVDGKLVALVDETPNVQARTQIQLTGTPSAVSNIPDPRFSERGGKLVPNVKIITRRNPNYDPKKKDSRQNITSGDAPAGPNDEFQEVAVPDVGAGSKEIGAQIERAEADRLTAALPFKLYAPIHPQAADRYLGEKNYARLGLDPEKYFKSYTQQPFKHTDVQQQYNWNDFVMSVYGPMLYAFVTDMNMQKTSPVFTMVAPVGVTREFMELNELIVELERYQSKSADRSSRVGDSAVAQEPIEKHLDDFFKSRDNEEQEKLADANVVMIALPGQGPSDKPVPKPARPGGGGDKPDKPVKPKVLLNTPNAPTRFGAVSNNVTKSFGHSINAIANTKDIDEGVRNLPLPLSSTREIFKNVNTQNSRDSKVEKRSVIFRRFNR